MKEKKRKISIKAGIIATAALLGVSGVIALSVINSSNLNFNDLFAEIILSNSTSILADKSFSEYTYNGFKNYFENPGDDNLDKKTKINVDISRIPEGTGLWRRPGSTSDSTILTYKGVFANGKKLIVAPGFNHADPIQKALKDPTINDRGFLLLDSAIDDPSIAGNVASVIFRTEQASFQAGIAASHFLWTNKHIFNKDGHLRMGGYVGLAFPSTLDFLIGFQKGMMAYNDMHKDDPGFQAIEWINLGTDSASDFSAYAAGGFGPSDGDSKIQDLLGLGADAIIPIAGPQAAAAANIISATNRQTIIIGVDSALENQSINKPFVFKNSSEKLLDYNGNEIKNAQIIQFSAEKKLDVATENILRAITNKKDPNNQDAIDNKKISAIYGGFGYTNIAALNDDGAGAVSISPAGMEWFTKGVKQKNGSNNGFATDYKNAIEIIKNNEFFKHMVSDPNSADEPIQFYNTVDGKQKNNARNINSSVLKYKNQLNTSVSSVIVNNNTRLDGSKW